MAENQSGDKKSTLTMVDSVMKNTRKEHTPCMDNRGVTYLIIFLKLCRKTLRTYIICKKKHGSLCVFKKGNHFAPPCPKGKEKFNKKI